jgi:hypothetical protein
VGGGGSGREWRRCLKEGGTKKWWEAGWRAGLLVEEKRWKPLCCFLERWVGKAEGLNGAARIEMVVLEVPTKRKGDVGGP